MNPDFTRYQPLPNIEAQSLVGTRSTRVPIFSPQIRDAAETRPYQKGIEVLGVGKAVVRQSRGPQQLNSSRT